MKKIEITIIVLILSISNIYAQNYFLKEMQNNPVNDVKYGTEFRIKTYLDSLNQNTSNSPVFDSDSTKRAYYQKIISNINYTIKYNPENPENYVFKGIYKSMLFEYDSAEILMNKAIEIDPDYAEAYLERGALFLTRREIKNSISDFKTALKIDPNYTDAIYNLGYVYFQLKNYDQAKKYFEKAISVFEYHYQSYIQLGYLYLLEKDFENSIKNYNKAVEIRPFESTAYNLRGQVHLQKNEIEKAKVDFEKSYSLDPSNYSVLFILAFIEMEFGNLEEGLKIISKGTKILNRFTFSDKISDYPEAELNDIIINYNEYISGYQGETRIELNKCIKDILLEKNLYKVIYSLEKIIKEDNSLILPQRLLVNCLYKKRINYTIKALDKLLELDSSLAYVLILKGDYLRYNEKYTESIAYYNKALEIVPDYSSAYTKRAWTKYRQWKIEDAFVDVQKAMDGVTPYLDAINIKALLLGALKRYQESLELYNLAINYFPDQAFLYNNRALTYLDMNETEKAIKDYNKGIEINPRYSLTYTNRGKIYFDKGNKDKALKDFNKALEVNPTDKYALRIKANALLEWGDTIGTIDFYENMIEKGINTKNCYYGLAKVYNSMEKFQIAIEKSSKAISMDESYLNAYIQRAKSKSSLKEFEGAQSDLDKVLSIDSTHVFALYEKARIYSENDEIKKSLNEYIKVIEIDSTSHTAYGNIGWNYYLLEEYENCIKWSEKAIEFNNEALFAMYNIALSYLCLGEFEKSKELYKKYYNQNKQIDEPISDGSIQDLKDLVKKGSNVDNAKYILKNIFTIDDI
ncbi:MAG: tetratricopeptide repeat protein [Bacteroidales bacterium]|nr:tetratricopeptide repeat protein [Bacteroidales bacterium]